MKTCLFVLILFLLATTASAEDQMKPVFEQIDELVIRVDSGISLNSFAETLASWKIAYKKAIQGENYQANPLLDDRIQDVIRILDDYSAVWKFHEIDGYKFINAQAIQNIASRYQEMSKYLQTQQSGRYIHYFYSISDVKYVILNELNNKIGNAKSAHYNGW